MPYIPSGCAQPDAVRQGPAISRQRRQVRKSYARTLEGTLTGEDSTPQGTGRHYPRQESKSLSICQYCAMDVSGIVVQPVGERNFEASVQFLMDWVSNDETEARMYLADHAEPEGAGLLATRGHDVVGYAAILWESNFAGFRDRGIPLIHQVAVAEPFRRQGVATLLMDGVEQMARERGIATLGITVGLFDEYGPAQRLYGQRGYIPDGRGACRGQRPVGKGMLVAMDDDLIMWLTKNLVS
jgi:GNAT superfamily N-acetyltransferase